MTENSSAHHGVGQVRNSVDAPITGPVVQAGVINGNVHITVLPPTNHGWTSPHVARFQLPPDLTDFVGRRSETRFVKQRLLRERGRAASGLPLVGIYGPPGVGKTTLAVHAAHRLSTAFPDGQLYANLRGAAPHRREPSDVLAGFLRTLGVAGDALPAQLEDRVALYRSLLHNGRVLVVLDNAFDEQQIRPLLPGSPTTAVLVTSRMPMSGLDGVTLIGLDPLPPDAAVRLLRLLAGRKARTDQDLARRIVRYCGGLPLAVRIAGARLAGEPSLSLADLGDRLAGESRRLDELHVADRAVRVSFELSYRILPDQQRRLFRLLGLLGSVSFAPWLAAALVGVDVRDIEVQLAGLVRAQLMIPLAGNRYRLHDLIRLFATESMARGDGEDRASALSRAAAACISLVQQINGVVFPSAALSSGDMLARPGAIALFDVEKDTILSIVEALCDANQTELAWRTAAELPALLQMLGDWDDWSRMSGKVLAVTATAGDFHGHARVLLEWGNLCRERSAWDEAADAYQRARDLLNQVGDVHWEADALASLGAVYRDQDRLEESATALREAIDLFGRVGSRRGEALALSNLGTTFLRQADDVGAERCFRRCLTVFRELDDRRWEAYSLGDLAHVLERRQLWEPAIEYRQRALSILREYRDQLGIGRCLGNLGDIRLKQGRLDQALAHYSECAQIMEQLGSPYETARAMRRLSEVSSRKGDPARAAEYERRGRELDSRAWSIAW